MGFATSALILAIEVLSSLIIVGYVVYGLWLLCRHRSITDARLAIAQGAIFGLSFKTAASLLKTITLETWRQILIFAVILSLRILLKRIFTWEQQQASKRQPRLGSHFTSATPAR